MILLLPALLLVDAAWAAPDRVAASFTAGTEVRDIVASEDGAWVGWTESGAGSFTVLDTATWATQVVAVCDGVRGAAVRGTLEGYTFFTGCADGTVTSVSVNADGLATEDADPVSVGDGQVYAVDTDGTTVFAVVEDTEEGTVVVAFLADDGTDPGLTAFPAALGADGVEDSVVVGNTLVLTHRTDDISKVDMTGGSAVYSQGTLGSRTYGDAWPQASTSTAWLADTGGGLVKYGTGDNDFNASLTAVADTVTALAILEDQGFLLLGAGSDTLVYAYSGGPGAQEDVIVGASNITEFVWVEGYALGATSDGFVHVLTELPWVTVSDLSPSSAVEGDRVSLSFTSDTAGNYRIIAGGTRAADGALLLEGGIDAGASETVEIEVTDAFAEGVNRIWVFVDGGGRTGHAAGSLVVDNPPSEVPFGPSDVGFGNASISVAFAGIDDADLSFYAIYVDVEPFTAAEFPVGGPGFTGSDAVTSPLLVTAEPGASVSRTIYPVTNGTTYYVAVRAYDDGGLEGPMSEVYSVTPQPTFSASQLAGEEGWSCGLGGGAGLPAVLLGAAAVARRRRIPGATAALSALLFATLAVPAAHAKDTETPRRMNVQVRYGPITLEDPYVSDVFGAKVNEILWFEYGFASQYVDANLGVGFYQEMGWLQTSEGAASDEHDMFTMLPVTLSLTGRLDLVKEQPLVPFGRIGLDYWMWRENWYVPDPDTLDASTTGGKPGWHFGGGLLLLLDGLDRRASSRLESTAGIDDTYLVAEYRRTLLVHGEDQLNLSSEELTFGLKFDF